MMCVSGSSMRDDPGLLYKPKYPDGIIWISIAQKGEANVLSMHDK